MNGPVNSCLEDGLCAEDSDGTDVHKHFQFVFKSPGSVPQNSSLASSSALVNSNRMALPFLDETWIKKAALTEQQPEILWAVQITYVITKVAVLSKSLERWLGTRGTFTVSARACDNREDAALMLRGERLRAEQSAVHLSKRTRGLPPSLPRDLQRCGRKRGDTPQMTPPQEIRCLSSKQTVFYLFLLLLNIKV